MIINICQKRFWSRYDQYEDMNIRFCYEEVISYLKQQRRSKNCWNSFLDILKKIGPQENIVIEALKKTEYNFNRAGKFQECIISDINEDIPIQFILQQWSRKYTKKEVLYLFNSQIDEQFFKILNRNKWKLRIISLQLCWIQNSLQRCIRWLEVQRLEMINISDDPITNKGLKMMFSLNLPQLQSLTLQNLNCTSDVLNNMQKLNTKAGFQNCTLTPYSYQRTFKKIKNLFNLFTDNDQFLYKKHGLAIVPYNFIIAEISKLRLKDNQLNYFFLAFDLQVSIIPQRTLYCLNEMIKYMDFQ